MFHTLEEHAEALRTRGYTVLEGVLDRDQIEAARIALDAIFEREKKIGPLRGWHNKMYRVAYMLPQKHALFRSLCLNPQLLPLMQMLLGKDCVLGSLNGLTMIPGGETQKLHIDQKETVADHVLYINALHTLDDFTRANGCTRVIPFSQNRPWNRHLDMTGYEHEAVYVEAPAGSVIAWNAGLWHAGSRNETDRPRRALHALFHRPWVQPHWDFARSLSPRVLRRLSPEEQRLFGLHDQPSWYNYRADRVFRNGHNTLERGLRSWMRHRLRSFQTTTRRQ